MCGQSGLLRLRAQALATGIPLGAHLELTAACNQRCSFCCNATYDDEDPLELADWLRLLDDLRELGTLSIGLSGGEPLLHPCFFAIARAARERHFALRILTNGVLIDDELAADIAELVPMAVELSLHGATPQSHDRITRLPGSFDAMWNGIDALRRHRVRVLLKTVVTSHNIAEVDELLALAAARGIPLRFDLRITPREDGDRQPLRHAVSGAEAATVLARLRDAGRLPDEERRLGGCNCGAGATTVAIDPAGNVFPCAQWRQLPMGNLRHAPLRELWHESPARHRARQIAHQANDVLVRMGGAASRFPYCPALTDMLTGDALRPDRLFMEYARAAEELRASP